MKLTRLHAENFLSFRVLDLDLRDAGLTLVEGENLDDDSAMSNGSGKSAIVDALLWCLFGVTLRGYENDDVVHRKVGKDCSVYLDMEAEHGEYRVLRARRHSEWKNSLTLSTQGADASGPTARETQVVIESLLGCTFKTFVTSVVFGQDRAYRFSSLTDKEQKEILDEVLGVERFALACLAARQEKAEHDGKVDAVNSDFARVAHDRDRAREEATDLRKKDASFEKVRKADLDAERKALRDKEAALAKLEDVDLEAVKKKVAAAKKKEDEARARCRTSEQEQSAARTKETLLDDKVGELSARIRKHESISGECPTCSQVVDKKHHKRVLAELRSQHKAAEAEYLVARKAVERAKEDVVAALAAAEAMKSAVRLAEKEHDVATRADADARVLRADVRRCRERVEELAGKENPYTQLAERVEKRADGYDKEAAKLEKALEAAEAKLKLADFWVEAFGARGLRSLLLDGSLPIVNEEAARVSNAVTGGAISIEFSATSDLKSGKTVDRFEVRVDNKHGAASYRGNSAGERAKVDLCVGLALQKLVASRATASFNVLFADEIFDHLDAAAHERVVEVLAGLDRASVFVISHNEDLKAWFPNTLRVVKEDGYSRVEA